MDNLWIIYGTGWWLSHPTEKYESVGMMTFPTEWKNKSHVPNHQPDFIKQYEWRKKKLQLSAHWSTQTSSKSLNQALKEHLRPSKGGVQS